MRAVIIIIDLAYQMLLQMDCWSRLLFCFDCEDNFAHLFWKRRFVLSAP